MKVLFKPPVLATMALLAVGTAKAVDWRLFSRSLTYPDRPITDVDWYRPLQPVPGIGTAAALPTSPTPTIPITALQSVADFAEAQNSVGLLVLHRDRLVLERYWQGQQPDDLINSMSMVKTLLALLIGIAIEDGHIGSMDDPVGQYIEEWADDPRGAMTLADLLYMQSGLKNDNRTNTLRSDLVQMYGGSDVDRKALSIPLAQAPGQGFDYNNANSQILSIVLERATGESFGSYLSQQLWQPLQASDGFLWLDRPRGHAKAFCCFFATARDWARVGQMLLHQGQVGAAQVVPADWLQTIIQESPLEPTFGAHIWIKARTPEYKAVNTGSSVPFLAKDTFYLDGRHHQRVYIIPSAQLVIVRVGEDPPAWDDSVIPNTLVESLNP